ncbi:hypothetical protein BN133_2239 [Cronobacter dublinensis 582]|nr:hypothetical protein BN133_2239 [Cronobacter dublinensis 582]
MAGDTSAGLLSTRDTVWCDTPAFCATSSSVLSRFFIAFPLPLVGAMIGDGGGESQFLA